MVIKTNNNSNIEQLHVKLRHNDKVVIFRFFVVLNDSPVLLGMPDMEVLSILRITCRVIDGQQACRKFVPQMI